MILYIVFFILLLHSYYIERLNKRYYKDKELYKQLQKMLEKQ